MNNLITRLTFFSQSSRYCGILVGSTSTTLTIQLANGSRKTIGRFGITDLHVSVEDLGEFKLCLKCGDFTKDSHDCEELWTTDFQQTWV